MTEHHDGAAVARVGLVVVATGVLALVSVRGYLEDSAATARDLTFGFAIFFVLALLASLRTPPRWSVPFSFAVTAGAYLWGSTLKGGRDEGVVVLILAAGIAYVIAEREYRPLVVAGFALWTPALDLFEGTRAIASDPLLFAAAIGALALFLLAVFRPERDREIRLRRIGQGILAIAIVSAVYERHDVVASLVLAPDDVMAGVSVVVLFAVRFVPMRFGLRDAISSGVALATYTLLGIALILGKPYHVDAVTAPHHAAELLLRGEDPYVAFDMSDALAEFGLPQTLATKLDDGSYLHSLNYPAASFLVVAPFVAAGLHDVRWVYLGEMLVMALLLIGRARVPWRPLVAVLIVGNTVLTRQYVLAGIDPTWALGVAVAWLFVEHGWVSPVALGIAAADRQPAWFFVPFYLLAMWRIYGARAAVRRAAVAGLAFLALNLPFFLASPSAYVSSVLAPMAGPLEAYGVGIVRLSVLGPLPHFPRLAYGVAGAVVLAGLLLLLWRRWRDLPNGALTFPLVPLFFAWRSLQNYFVFLPLIAILRDEDLVRPEPAAAPAVAATELLAVPDNP